MDETAGEAPVKKKVRATPVSRAIAKDLGIDINDVKGTGPAGRVTKDDILNFSKSTARQTTSTTKSYYSWSNLTILKVYLFVYQVQWPIFYLLKNFTNINTYYTNTNNDNATKKRYDNYRTWPSC